MPVWKLQTSFGADNNLPRDRAVITPHFNDGGVGSDPQQLCEDWLAAIDALVPFNREIIVKAYDAEGSQPVYPAGEASVNLGMAPDSDTPREVALCLSFYSTRNIPRRRGRLYIPWYIFSQNRPSVRPDTIDMGRLTPIAEAAQALGGADVDWVVYSRLDSAAYPITNWWVDNEWDTIRSRGMRSTARISGTTSEA